MTFKEWCDEHGVEFTEPSVAAAVQYSDETTMTVDDWLDWQRSAFEKAKTDRFYFVEDSDGQIIAITGNGERSAANAFAIAEALSQGSTE